MIKLESAHVCNVHLLECPQGFFIGLVYFKGYTILLRPHIRGIFLISVHVLHDVRDLMRLLRLRFIGYIISQSIYFLQATNYNVCVVIFVVNKRACPSCKRTHALVAAA